MWHVSIKVIKKLIRVYHERKRPSKTSLFDNDLCQFKLWQCFVIIFFSKLHQVRLFWHGGLYIFFFSWLANRAINLSLNWILVLQAVVISKQDKTRERGPIIFNFFSSLHLTFLSVTDVTSGSIAILVSLLFRYWSSNFIF